MSVINDMLQDLEQRRYDPAEPGHAEIISGSQAAITKPAWHRLSWWLIGLMMVCLMAGIAWGYVARVSTETPYLASVALPESPTEQAPREQAVSSPAVAPTPSAAGLELPSQAQFLKRIELRKMQQNHALEMEFNQPLDLPALHYRQGDRLWLQLYSTDVSSFVLPELTGQAPIKQWRAYLEGGYQMITLQLMPAYQAELIQLEPRLWQLSLKQTTKSSHQPVKATAGHATTAKAKQQAVSQAKPSAASHPILASTAAPSEIRKTSDNIRAAKKALAKGQPQAAEKLLKGLLAEQPEHLLASLLLSQLYLSTAAPEQAEPVILSALQYHPEHPELITYFARCLMTQGRVTEAGDYLVKTMRPGQATHLGLLANIRQRQAQHRQARDYYQQALKLKPDEVTWLAGLGISQEHLGDMEAAKQAYRRSLRSGSLNLTLKTYVADRLIQLKQD
jgi:tetratricopeptide (TPR) repeat protein